MSVKYCALMCYVGSNFLGLYAGENIQNVFSLL